MFEQDRGNKFIREGTYGVLKRINVGKAVVTLAAIEGSTGTASIAAGSPIPIALGTIASLWIAGDTLHNLHNNRHTPKENVDGFTHWVTKPDEVK